ncbi:hypothetical protein [Cellulomonas endophytica]|uniref:hypothetical protein n=1 Tax=Cellulomonas endophytica TaxID=2494735 RepID=UPI0010128BE0|nr:hypothetical protein [Cellulomonas endophytica]
MSSRTAAVVLAAFFAAMFVGVLVLIALHGFDALLLALGLLGLAAGAVAVVVGFGPERRALRRSRWF